MKIGLSVSVIQRGKSGVATYVGGLLRGMAANNWPVEICLFGLEEDREWFAPWLKHCEWVGVSETFRPAVRNIFWHQIYFPPLLRRHRCDLVHIPSYRRIVAYPGMPQVVTIHDLAPFRLAGKYDALRMFYGKQIVKKLAQRADAVVAVSETTAADVREFFDVPPERLSVIYNGIDYGRLTPLPREEISRRLPVTEGWLEPWWLYVARLEHPAKNHLRLLQAFASVCAAHPSSTFRLVLAGADWHGAAEIHQAIAESPVRDRIHCAGFVSDEELTAWYSGARALVFPSLFEGFGLPPIEAMACGCPVLCSDRGSLLEVTGGAAGIFDPENTEAIASSMQNLLASSEQQTARIQAGHQRAAHFRWESCAKETSEVYAAVCKQSNP